MCLEYNCLYMCHTVLFTLSWGHITCSAGNSLNFRNYISCSLLIHLIKVQWNYLAYVSFSCFSRGAVRTLACKFLSVRMFLPFSLSPPNRFQIEEGVQDSFATCQFLQQNIRKQAEWPPKLKSLFCWYSIYISKGINWKSILLKTVLSIYSNGKKLLNDGLSEINLGHLNLIRATSWLPLARMATCFLNWTTSLLIRSEIRFSADLFVIHKWDTFVRHWMEWFHKYDQIITSDVHRTIKTSVASKLFR